MDCGNGDKIDEFKNNVTSWDSWKKNQNATACFNSGGDYGLYQNAVNLTLEESVVTRYVFSLFWGFQVLLYILINSAYFLSDQIVYRTIA